jgi:hypothetical protein
MDDLDSTLDRAPGAHCRAMLLAAREFSEN